MAENCNENCIEWIKGSEFAGVTASEIAFKNQVLELAKKRPEDVKIIAMNNDGSIYAHVPRKYIKLRAPRILTEEQRVELVERGKNMSRNKSTDCEETSDFDSDDEDEENVRCLMKEWELMLKMAKVGFALNVGIVFMFSQIITGIMEEIYIGANAQNVKP